MRRAVLVANLIELAGHDRFHVGAAARLEMQWLATVRAWRTNRQLVSFARVGCPPRRAARFRAGAIEHRHIDRQLSRIIAYENDSSRKLAKDDIGKALK